jgi:hypothetical protein
MLCLAFQGRSRILRKRLWGMGDNLEKTAAFLIDTGLKI